MLQERPSPSILQATVIGAVIFIVLVFVIIVMNTGDILWFWPLFDEMPYQIVVYCYGEDIILKPDNPSYEAVNTVVNESLSGTKRWDPLSMSEVTYADYHINSTMMVLELTYDPPVRMHSFYKFYKNIDTLVVPLDGRHASSNSVFGRLRGHTLAGSMHIKTRTSMIITLDEQNLCPKP